MRIPLYIMRRNLLKNFQEQLAEDLRTREKYVKTNPALVAGMDYLIEKQKQDIAKLEAQIAAGSYSRQ